MVKRSKGFFSKGTKATKMKKKLTVNEFVKPFGVGDKVVIAIKPHLGGIPHPRYNGRGGEIAKRQGNCYAVKIRDGGAEKMLIVNPVHITRAGAKKAA